MMLSIISEAWTQLSAIGLLIAVLLFILWHHWKFLIREMKTHREERDEWREVIDKGNTKVVSVISELSALIKANNSRR